LKSIEARDWRPLILLVVLVSHSVIVVVALRVARLVIATPTSSYEPLMLMLLPNRARTADGGSAPRAAESREARRPSKREPTLDNAISAPFEEPTQPKTDWAREAELAIQNELAAAERDKGYRDLSALTPAQRSWITQNHMEPVPPGIPWKHPRVEITPEGLPIIWVNDHCVIVPLMAMMMFCKIGHIEANGDLFKHMHDPHEP
jgi:hypothetical protein